MEFECFTLLVHSQLHDIFLDWTSLAVHDAGYGCIDYRAAAQSMVGLVLQHVAKSVNARYRPVTDSNDVSQESWWVQLQRGPTVHGSRESQV